MDKKVSIIIPAYNAENHINKCIFSVINQSYKNIEIILVNNGSTDNTLNICMQWAKKDSRIKILDQKNKGVSNARNQGIKQAIGEYIVFVDSDDYLQDNSVEILYNHIENKDIDVVYCDYYNVTKKEIIACEEILDYKVYHAQDISIVIRNMFGGGRYYSSIWRGIYKKSIIDEKELRFKQMKYAEDLLYNIEYLINCNNIEIISDKLYCYVQNNDSSLQKLKHNVEEIKKVPYEIYQTLKKYQCEDNYLLEIEKEIELSIRRIFDINYRYCSFRKNICGLNQFVKDIYQSKHTNNCIINLVLKDKVCYLYCSLLLNKICSKFIKILGREI